MMLTNEKIQAAADVIRQSKRPSILTGAGVSKESGIPTFRDALEGLWAKYDPQRLATATAFQRDPKLVWDFYEYRRTLMRPAEPNPGHFALAGLERWFPGIPLITQNIDDLHERAGSTNVIHLHGLIAQDKCFFNCQGEPTLVDVSKIEWDRESGPPPCPHCGRWVRPNVVWFGELLPKDKLNAAKQTCETTDLMIVVGTSGVVNPAAEMPYIAKYHGAKIIEANPYESEITPAADIWLDAPSGEALPQVIALLEKHA